MFAAGRASSSSPTRSIVTTALLPAAARFSTTSACSIDWTSLDGDERLRARPVTGCPTITPPDDYCFGPVDRLRARRRPIAPARSRCCKENTQATAAIGESLCLSADRSRSGAVSAFPHLRRAHHRRPDSASAADLRLLWASLRSRAPSRGRRSNTGPATPAPVIEDTTIGIDIPALASRSCIELTVVIEDTPTNVSGPRVHEHRRPGPTTGWTADPASVLPRLSRAPRRR